MAISKVGGFGGPAVLDAYTQKSSKGKSGSEYLDDKTKLMIFKYLQQKEGASSQKSSSKPLKKKAFKQVKKKFSSQQY